MADLIAAITAVSDFIFQMAKTALAVAGLIVGVRLIIFAWRYGRG